MIRSILGRHSDGWGRCVWLVWFSVLLIGLTAGGSMARGAAAPGYTIPVVDVTGDSQRYVVVDRVPGQYLGHPTTVLLEDGRTMLCVYPQGHGRGPIQLQRSVDGGRTWSGRLPVPENWSTSQETPTIHRVVDAAGKRRLIVWSGLYPARLAVSEDDGATWSPLRPAGDWGGIVVMGSLEPKRDQPGHYLAWFHDDGRYFRAGAAAEKPPVFHLYQVASSDGGLTWSVPREIWAGSDIQLCEPGVIRSPDGRQLAMLLRENSRRRNSHVMFSDDEGGTWSLPRELPGALTGDRHVGKYAPDGRLFISFRDTTRESATQGDWVGWVGTYDDLRQGREGQYRVRLGANHQHWDCAYPGVELLPDGNFVATTYGHWVTNASPYVVNVRFSLPELDARAAARVTSTDPGLPPGVVLAHAYPSTQRYLGSPSLAVLGDGTLVASHDFFGKGTTADTVRVYGSADGGASWQLRSETKGFWSSLWTHQRALYLLGSSRQDGWIVIRRSVDGGRSWTEPVDAQNGLLRADGKFHGGAMPVLVHGGRVWRAMEDLGGPGGWPTSFRSIMLSAPANADLLVATNWSFSNPLGRDSRWLEGKFGGWLEGNAVATPTGAVVNFLRVDYREFDERGAQIQVSPDGLTRCLIRLPDLCRCRAAARSLSSGRIPKGTDTGRWPIGFRRANGKEAWSGSGIRWPSFFRRICGAGKLGRCCCIIRSGHGTRFSIPIFSFKAMTCSGWCARRLMTRKAARTTATMRITSRFIVGGTSAE